MDRLWNMRFKKEFRVFNLGNWKERFSIPRSASTVETIRWHNWTLLCLLPLSTGSSHLVWPTLLIISPFFLKFAFFCCFNLLVILPRCQVNVHAHLPFWIRNPIVFLYNVIMFVDTQIYKVVKGHKIKYLNKLSCLLSELIKNLLFEPCRRVVTYSSNDTWSLIYHRTRLSRLYQHNSVEKQ